MPAARPARPSFRPRHLGRAFLAALALALLSAPALAEPVRVRSGEHPGFSRLVVEFADRPDWSVRDMGDRVDVIVTPAGRSFDLSQVFTRIPRTRIREVTATRTGLALTLGCACRVTAFEARAAALVIDVADARPDAGVTAVVPTAATEDTLRDSGIASPEARPPVIADRVAAGLRAPVAEPGGGGEGPGGSLRDVPPTKAAPSVLPPAAPDAPPSPDTAPQLRASTLDRLAEGVARAASQGVLRLAPRPDRTAEPGPVGVRIGGAPDANLRLRIPGEEEWTDAPDRSERCLGDDAFDLAAWSDPASDPGARIADARGRLAEAVDFVDEARAVDLARLYITLGFGAEARAVIAALAPRGSDAAVLVALAHIVDDDPIPIAGLADQVDCPGRAQLWAALATGDPGKPEDTLVAIAELPVALRRHLAARLIPMFLEAGDAATAEAVRASVQRASGPHGDGFDLASARIDAEVRRPAGLAAIRDLAGRASPTADAALELYLALGNDAGAPAEPPFLARAEARADDLGGTDAGARIEAEYIRAAIRSGAFDLAGTRLADALRTRRLPEGREDDIVADYVAALAGDASDEVMLVNAAAFETVIAPIAARGPAGSHLAGRLVDLGFLRLARAYAPADHALDAILAAELHMRAGDPASALALLDTVPTPDDRHLALRAATLLALDRPAEAAKVFDDLGDEEGAAAARLTARLRAELAERGRATSGARDGQADALPGIVEASGSARTWIEGLLRDLPQP